MASVENDPPSGGQLLPDGGGDDVAGLQLVDEPATVSKQRGAGSA